MMDIQSSKNWLQKSALDIQSSNNWMKDILNQLLEPTYFWQQTNWRWVKMIDTPKIDAFKKHQILWFI